MLPEFPWYIVMRAADFNAEGNLTVSDTTAFPAVIVDGVRCFPVFTDFEGSKRYMAENLPSGKIATLYDMEAAITMAMLNPEGVIFVEIAPTGSEEIHAPQRIFAELAGQQGESG